MKSAKIYPLDNAMSRFIQLYLEFVIPAEAGIQRNQSCTGYRLPPVRCEKE